MRDRGAEIAVSEQVAGNANLVRRCDRPRGCPGIAAVVRSYADPEVAGRVPDKDSPDRRIREGASAWTHPHQGRLAPAPFVESAAGL